MPMKKNTKILLDFSISVMIINDKIFLMVDKIDHEFLYVSSLASGVGIMISV